MRCLLRKGVRVRKPPVGVDVHLEGHSCHILRHRNPALPPARRLASLSELPDDAEDDFPLALRQAQRLAGNLARRLVPEATKQMIWCAHWHLPFRR